MNILGRIKFPGNINIAGLYIKGDEDIYISYSFDDQKIILKQNSILSLDSYFNSFYETFYIKYTNITCVYYLLSLEGDFKVSAYRELYNKDRQLIHIDNFKNCQKSNYVHFSIPSYDENQNVGRLYLEIECLSETGILFGGFISTDQQPDRQISLGIITCTFQKEDYLRKTISAILEDEILKTKNINIIIIDNGKTLDKNIFKDERVKLIYNQNSGGSGGFARGLVEALSQEELTHFLLMDDDIELESESIYKLFSIYEYAKEDLAVAGSMLDLCKKHILYESGALYGVRSDYSSYDLLSRAPLKHNIYLQNTDNLNSLLIEETPDYGGFWFFCVSKNIILKTGLVMPFFIKVDDIEFCLRIQNYIGEKIVAFPSIAVWHEPFYTKIIVWNIYYEIRNSLITSSIHQSLKYLPTIARLTRRLLSYVFVFDYNSAQMLLNAFEDYLQGSNFLKNANSEIIHIDIVKASNSYTSRLKLKGDSLFTNKFYEPSDAKLLKKILMLITLNGHLLPDFLLSDEPGFMMDKFGNWHKAFRKKEIIVFDTNTGFYQNTLNKSTGNKMIFKWIKLVIKSCIIWSSINSNWKKSIQELTSIKFWQHYFNLNKV